MILDTQKTVATKWHDQHDTSIGLGLVHHMILLMMWSRYQVTTLAYGQETLTIFDQQDSQLEAY